MYTVIKHFTDLQDSNYKYVEGDTYPREGYTPTKERISELASDKNKQKTALIKDLDAPEVIETETVETSAEEEPAPEKPKRKRSKKTAE